MFQSPTSYEFMLNLDLHYVDSMWWRTSPRPEVWSRLVLSQWSRATSRSFGKLEKHWENLNGFNQIASNSQSHRHPERKTPHLKMCMVPNNVVSCFVRQETRVSGCVCVFPSRDGIILMKSMVFWGNRHFCCSFFSIPSPCSTSSLVVVRNHPTNSGNVAEPQASLAATNQGIVGDEIPAATTRWGAHDDDVASGNLT